MEVLEFGCGTGSTALVHAPFVKHILATDISANMLDIARDKAEAANIENVTFQRTTLDDLASPDGTFDSVLGLNILHLLEDRDAAISNVYRLLKPGGIFVSSTVCIGDSAWRYIRPIAPLARLLGLMPHLAIFKERNLIASLTKAGFAIDHHWRPEKSLSVFIAAKKAD